MSLKAKIEAVIYASEEPVTLQQLVGLLGQEAQAELEAADARQGQLVLLDAETTVELREIESGDPDALNAETLGLENFAAATSPADKEVEPEKSQEQQDLPAAATEPERADDERTSSGNESPSAEQNEHASVSKAPTDPEAPSPGASNAEEALSVASTEPSPAELRARERRLREYMRSLLEELIADYRTEARGLEIREVAGGFRFATKPEYHDAVRGFVRSLKPPLKLSLQALETLAVVAYKQPVTAPEVSEIRGVDSGGVLGSLMTRKLVTTAGRKQVIGRPILYKTTKEFLLRFGLRDTSELPSIEEFERLASDMNEAVQEEIPMAPEQLDQLRPGPPVGDAPRDIEPMRDTHDAQPDGIPDDTDAPNEQADAEHTMPAPDSSGEFTGDETVPPADNVEVDGRISGVPPSYDKPSVGIDSPAMDAEIQGSEQLEMPGVTTK